MSIIKSLEVYEVDVLEGLEQTAKNELSKLGSVVVNKVKNGTLNFTFKGKMKELKQLRTVITVYAQLYFAIPRPKAFLGDENQRKLLSFLEFIISQDNFTSFRFSAAGHDSTIFKRLSEVITKQTGLPFVEKEGDLLLRVRPNKAKGWEVLARLTPRPLSARPWRVCNIAGGLNATLAVAMLELAEPKLNDYIFNPMCGSGTLLIETCQNPTYKYGNVSGCDKSSSALNCAQQNILAGGLQNKINLFLGDATKLSISSLSIDVIVCDLPWGDAVGTNKANAKLYPAFLKEMTRIAKEGTRMVLLSHDIKLTERLIASFSSWTLKSKHRVFHGGHYPRMYLLIKK